MLLGRNGGEIKKSNIGPKSKRRLSVGSFRFDCNEIVGEGKQILKEIHAELNKSNSDSGSTIKAKKR